jgi:steroid delta-isomerase-like uncharacterized protein
MHHVAAVERMYRLINAGDIDGFAALLADDFVDREETPGFRPGRDGVTAEFRKYRAAFPDMRVEPEDIFPSGDTVVVRYVCAGTHRGDFMGMPATGKFVTVGGIDIWRFGEDGRCHEHWGVFDLMSLAQRLGAAPGRP